MTPADIVSAAIRLAADAHLVPVEAVAYRGRGNPKKFNHFNVVGRTTRDEDRAADARIEALYLIGVSGAASVRSLARAAGVHHTTILYALRRVEDSRDNPVVDARLSRLEQEIAHAA